MADIKYYVDIDLQNQELIGFKVDNSTTDPAALTGEGQLIYRTDTNVLKYHTGSGSWVTVGTSSGAMSTWVLTGDSGSNQTIDDGETVDIAGGTGLSSVVGATNTVTLNLDNTAVSAGSYTYGSFTVDAQGRLTAASSGSSPGTMSSWILTGDTGTQTVVDGNTVLIEGGTYITTVAAATDTVTITHDATSRSDTASAVSPGYAGTVDVVDSITTNATGHITAINVETVTFPSAESYSFSADGDSGPAQTISSGDTLLILGGTALSSVASATDTITLNLDNTAVSAGSYTYASVTVDAQGRLTSASSGSAPGTMSSWILTGDSGTQTVVDGNTVDIAGGTGITTVAAATDTLTVTLDDTAVTPGSYTYSSFTVDQQGRLTSASSGSSPGTMSSFIVAGTTGANQTISNGDTLTLTAGTGITTVGSATDTVTITNTGVTSAVASTGISVSGATGAVTFTNTGVTSIVAGTGISVSAATGAVTVTNTQTETDTTYTLPVAAGAANTALLELTAGGSGSGVASTTTFSGTTSEIAITESTGLNGTITIGLPDDVTIAGELTVSGTGQSSFGGQVTVPTTPSAATDAASKAYVLAQIGGVGAFQGGYNATTNSPALSGGSNVALNQGDFYVVSVSGTGFFSETLEVGDMIFADADIVASSSPAVTEYTVVIADENIAGAGATDGATNKGVAGFDSGNFSVSVNGWVTLDASGVTAASYGSASETLTATVDAQGLVTAMADTAISITASQVSDFCTAVATCVADESAVATIGDGSANTIDVTHTLGQDVIVQVVDLNNDYAQIFPEIQRTSTTNVRILTNTPIASSGAKVYIQKVS
tara:strand:+ start:4565 stop:7057 length:2493 start_codon:yes stop_codon:yes gene_type:complete